jgi:phosphopantetheine adenylyltransferase
MIRRRALALIALFTFAVATGSVARAHEGHDHKILGTVTMVAADHVMLKDREGKDVTVKVTKDTKVKSKPALKVEEIKAGTRVVVTAVQEKDKSFTAKVIEVGPAPADAR